ncbi:hypothetical protein [Rhizobium leguminosarum]|uniref:aromatic-ring hydroxylase C-terminal domain-containing protein n=1 Tax=Rhizobium leguminosarum TaxID=384 RepID=UPI002F93906D
MSWFTLVTGIAGQAWEESVAALALPYLRCVRVGAGKYSDPYFYWARIRAIEEGDALLVRPDGVIAWRQKRAVSGKRYVSTLLSSVLGAVPARRSVIRDPGLRSEDGFSRAHSHDWLGSPFDMSKPHPAIHSVHGFTAQRRAIPISPNPASRLH